MWIENRNLHDCSHNTKLWHSEIRKFKVEQQNFFIATWPSCDPALTN